MRTPEFSRGSARELDQYFLDLRTPADDVDRWILRLRSRDVPPGELVDHLGEFAAISDVRVTYELFLLATYRWHKLCRRMGGVLEVAARLLDTQIAGALSPRQLELLVDLCEKPLIRSLLLSRKPEGFIDCAKLRIDQLRKGRVKAQADYSAWLGTRPDGDYGDLCMQSSYQSRISDSSAQIQMIEALIRELEG